MASHCGLNLYFPVYYDMEHFFSYAYLVKSLFRPFAHLSVTLSVSLLFTSKNSLFWIEGFIGYMFCKYFLPICGLSFSFLNNVFQRVFNLDEIQFTNF